MATEQRRLAAILAADIVGYSRLMGQDEEGTMAALRARRAEILDPLVASHRGRIVKTTGDGALVEFASAVDAVRCAVAIQNAMEGRNAAASDRPPIRLRIGINVGDIILEEGDIFGEGVNVAARLEQIADPGGILVSHMVHDQVAGRFGLALSDLGARSLKNILQPVRVFRVEPEGTPAAPAPAAPAEKPGIAVLAFTNMSGEAEQEFFSDGLSEDIITDLSKLAGLRVIARNSSFTYKGRAVDLRQVGRELDVGFVLEGSVRRAGNRVRVTGQLIDAATGAHLWAERFDRDLTDIFAVQDEITREIVAALKLTLTPQQERRLGHRRAIDPEAYQCLLRGRELGYLLQKNTNIEARLVLGRALEIDPGLAAAKAYFACTHLNDYVAGWSADPEASLAEGARVAAEAVATDPEDHAAHWAQAIALFWQRDYDPAMAAVERCLALAPNSAEGHLEKANQHVYRGEADQALATLQAYMRLDPHFPEIGLYFLAQAQEGVGDYAGAIATLEQRLARNPSSALTHALLASCHGHLGQVDQARAAWAELYRLSPDFSWERRRKVLPFRDPAIFERRLEGLRKAGLEPN